MSRSARRRARRRGFTLMEVLLVLVILVILGSMAGIFIRGARNKAMIDAARSQIGMFESAIDLYELNMMSFPSSAEGLQALIQPTGDTTNWTGPYLDKKEVPLDPWGNPYQYQLVDTETYQLWSYGPDGVDQTEDDIRNQQL